MVLCAGLSPAVIGGAWLLFLFWLVHNTNLVNGPPTNHNLTKFCCGRGMSKRWLDLDSPVLENIPTMNLFPAGETLRGRQLVLAVVLCWCFGSVRCLEQTQGSELTFQLQAGRSECFFQTAIKSGTMEVEYQVTVCDGQTYSASAFTVTCYPIKAYSGVITQILLLANVYLGCLLS